MLIFITVYDRYLISVVQKFAVTGTTILFMETSLTILFKLFVCEILVSELSVHFLKTVLARRSVFYSD